MRIACIGECMVELSELPGGTLTRGYGGDTLNTAVYLARLGAQVDYCTVLGDDPFSDEMLAGWQAEGVGTSLVLRLPGRLPGLYLIRRDAHGERSFFYWRGEAPARQLLELPGSDAIAEALAACGQLYLSGITLSLYSAAGRERLFATLQRARARGRGWRSTPISARAAGPTATSPARSSAAPSRRPTSCWPLPRISSCCSARLARPSCWPARRTARSCSSWPSPPAGSSWPVVELLVPAQPVADVVDTTAAGDSFAAGYLAARLAGADPEAAARAGHRLAGAVMRHQGALIPRDQPCRPSGRRPARKLAGATGRGSG